MVTLSPKKSTAAISHCLALLETVKRPLRVETRSVSLTIILLTELERQRQCWTHSPRRTGARDPGSFGHRRRSSCACAVPTGRRARSLALADGPRIPLQEHRVPCGRGLRPPATRRGAGCWA